MELRAEIADFLRTRRARLRPEEVGLGAGGTRRVPGLRREEVAVLASISVDWYVRIERGNLAGVSDDVLRALADALRLGDAERRHLADLARASAPSLDAGGGRTRAARRGDRAASGPEVGPGLRAIVDAMHGVAVWVRDERFDLLAANTLGRGLFAELYRSPVAEGNIARFALLDPRARTFYRDWDAVVDDVVAVLRGYVGASPDDRRLSGLVGELATRSDDFARRWAAHDVRFHRSGRKRFRHEVAGDLDLRYEELLLPAAPGLGVFVYYATDEDTRERLILLESWAGAESIGADLTGAEQVAAATDLEDGTLIP